jgi:hypothetical protein
MGGLGNQLFQIFATLAYAIQYNQPFQFHEKNTTMNRETYWDSLLSGLNQPKYLAKKRPAGVFSICKEPHFHYRKLPPPPPVENVFMYGYFQSDHYFSDHFHEIRDSFLGIQEKKHQFYKEKMEYRDIPLETTVSLHFRIGDYKHIQHAHPVIPISYYKNAIQHVKMRDPKLSHVLYFFEKADEDIVKNQLAVLQEKYPELVFLPVPHEWKDWEQLLAMSLCRHNIIANSSFSWWGAYFNDYEKKIVCFPEIWFGPSLSGHSVRDLLPNTWCKVGF